MEWALWVIGGIVVAAILFLAFCVVAMLLSDHYGDDPRPRD